MSTRDMDRVRALSEMVKEEIIEGFRRNSHKEDWVGQGLRRSLEKAEEEHEEWTMAMAQADPTNPKHVLHCRWEMVDAIVTKIQAMDDSGMLLPIEEAS